MCYDDNARPPDPPGATGTAKGEDLVLTSADGTPFAAFAAHPEGPSTGAQLVIYPDVRGLYQFYKELALRFAEVGITAIAIDYFGRTAGLTGRDESFEFMPHVGQLTLENIAADTHAALAYLRQGSGAGQPTFITGFCIGGTLTIYSGTDPSFGLAGIIPFYSGFRRAMDPARGTALDVAGEVKVPLLGLYGGADQGIPVEQVQELDAKLTAAQIEHEVVIYPDATHSFFDRRAPEFAAASADAWGRVLGFIAAHTNR